MWGRPQSKKQPREGRWNEDAALGWAGRQLAKGRRRGRRGAFLPAAGAVRSEEPSPRRVLGP